MSLGQLLDPIRGLTLEALEDESSHVRQAAAQALGDLADPRVTWRLALTLHSEEHAPTQTALLESLKRLPKEQALGQLARLLAVSKEGHRLAAVTVLEHLGSEEAVQHLLKGLSDEAASVRSASLRALTGATRKPALRRVISREINTIRALASDSDRVVAGRARKLYHAVMGRYP